MLERLKYVNSLGQTLIFGDWNGLYVNYNELHDFQWDVVSVNEQISGFERGIQTRKIPIRIFCTNKKEGMRKRNSLFEIPERDVLRGQYGRLWINGYYCECYVTASTKSYYSIEGQYMACELTISTDRPYWVKETSTLFASGVQVSQGGQVEVESEYLDFPYDFPYDYRVSTYRKYELQNEGFYDSRFRLTISGPVINPTIYVGDHLYQVNTEVHDGDLLVVDSSAKTITLTRVDGERVNVFDARNRDSYIFQDIPAGASTVLWDNSFDFTITLLEERSEPRWDLPTIDSSWDYAVENGRVIEYASMAEDSGLNFEIDATAGRAYFVKQDDAFDGADFVIEKGRLIAIYGD